MSTATRPSEPAAAPRGEAADGRRAPATGRPPVADPERTMRTCPNCGRELADQGCKLRCPNPACGYFLSCAEYH